MREVAQVEHVDGRKGGRRARALVWGALAVALLPGGALAQGVVVPEAEFNGTLEQATPLPLTTATATGVTDTVGDLDFFRTEFVAGNTLRLSLGPFAVKFSGRIQVLNESGVLLAEVARQGSDSSIVLDVALTAATPPGVGYIRVSNDLVEAGAPSTFAYTLQVAQGLAEVEPNDDAGTAGLLGSTFPTLGRLWNDTPSDDVFTFTSTEENSTAVVSLDYSLSLGLDLVVALFDADLNLLAFDFRNDISGSGGLQNPALVVPLPEIGTYFVLVTPIARPISQSALLSYALTLRLKTGTYEMEPNQSFVEALPIPLGGNGSPVPMHGTLQTAQDVDVYRISAPAGQELVVDLDTVSSVEVLDAVVSLFLREDSGLPFASGNDSSLSPAGATFSLINRDGYVRLVPPRGGDIFIAVGDRSNRGAPDGFDYRLTVSFRTPPPPESEPNNTTAAAGRLEDALPARGVIGSPGDVDVFLIHGEAGESLQVNVAAFGLGSFLDPTLTLRSPAGAVLGLNNDAPYSTDPFMVIPSLPQTGDYALEIRQQAGNTGTGASFYYEVRAVTSRLLTALLRNPDIDASTRVDGFDLAALSRAFGTEVGDPDFVTAADIFPDACNCVDGLDLAVLGDFFGSTMPATGVGNLLSDSVGDAVPFFGPATHLPDLMALSLAISGVPPNRFAEIGAFFDGGTTEGAAGLLSVDSDESGLTGSVGTPDAYAGERNLGSDLEVFFDTESAIVQSVPDPRGDIFRAFVARIGDTTVATFPSVSQRIQPRPFVLAELPTSSTGGSLSFSLPIALLGGTERASVAMLGLSSADVEPTDRLPNRGTLGLTSPFQMTSVIAEQRVCGTPVAPALPSTTPRIICQSNADCAAQAGTVCLDVDNLAGAPNPLVAGSVVLRTPLGPPGYRDFERGVCRVGTSCVGGIDAGSNQHNDTLDRVFPLGFRPVSPADSTLKWYTRDGLLNMGFRDAFFDPHVLGGSSRPPPDVDFYYFVGGAGDRAIVDIATADDGASFNSMIELYTTPLPLAILDPSTGQGTVTLNPSQITLIASTDDQGADLDPRLEAILPATGIYLVRVAASPVQTSFPGDIVNYTLYHESLRPDEISIPVILRGPLTTSRPDAASILAGLRFELLYDPAVVEYTGIDLALGLREINPSLDRTLSTSQEFVGETVPGSPGRIAVALRSMVGVDFTAINGITSLAANAERILLRLRFRAVGQGSSLVQFAVNSTTNGQPRANLALNQDQPADIYNNNLVFGPGIRVTVTGGAALTAEADPVAP